MSERLKGRFVGCPYHDDDYEACIQYSGQAPCDPPDGWRLVPTQETDDMADKGAQAIASWDYGCTWPEPWGADAERHRRDIRKAYRAMLKAAPSPGQEEL